MPIALSKYRREFNVAEQDKADCVRCGVSFGAQQTPIVTVIAARLN
jgi:hypothetical protein